MFAGSLGLQVTLLHRGVLNKGLLLVVTHLLSLNDRNDKIRKKLTRKTNEITYRDKSTSSRSTKCNRFLGTSGDGSEFLDRLLGDGADLLGPLGALGVGRVAAGLILTLLFIDSLALNHIVINLKQKFIKNF